MKSTESRSVLVAGSSSPGGGGGSARSPARPDEPALARPRPFRIQVVEEGTGRGVPLVELKTVNQIRYVTDSNGIVAFDEPGLFNRKVFFSITSHGYEVEKDGFGYRGKALEITEGGSAQIVIRRLNIARRLYRVTGAGIYRDSVLDRRPRTDPRAALERPGLRPGQRGECGVSGKIHWFWGDTNRPDYPLGNFHVPGATSELPGQGGLEPEVGVNLSYFVDDQGFARPTAPMPGEGPTWISGLIVLKDRDGRERMFAVLRQDPQDARSLRARARRVQSSNAAVRQGRPVPRSRRVFRRVSRRASVPVPGPWRRLHLLCQPLSAGPCAGRPRAAQEAGSCEAYSCLSRAPGWPSSSLTAAATADCATAGRPTRSSSGRINRPSSSPPGGSSPRSRS